MLNHQVGYTSTRLSHQRRLSTLNWTCGSFRSCGWLFSMKYPSLSCAESRGANVPFDTSDGISYKLMRLTSCPALPRKNFQALSSKFCRHSVITASAPQPWSGSYPVAEAPGKLVQRGAHLCSPLAAESAMALLKDMPIGFAHTMKTFFCTPGRPATRAQNVSRSPLALHAHRNRMIPGHPPPYAGGGMSEVRRFARRSSRFFSGTRASAKFFAIASAHA